MTKNENENCRRNPWCWAKFTNLDWLILAQHRGFFLRILKPMSCFFSRHCIFKTETKTKTSTLKTETKTKTFTLKTETKTKTFTLETETKTLKSGLETVSRRDIISRRHITDCDGFASQTISLFIKLHADAVCDVRMCVTIYLRAVSYALSLVVYV